MTENVVKEGSYKRSISALNHHHKPKFKSEAKIQKSVFLPDHYTKYILYNRTDTYTFCTRSKWECRYETAPNVLKFPNTLEISNLIIRQYFPKMSTCISNPMVFIPLGEIAFPHPLLQVCMVYMCIIQFEVGVSNSSIGETVDASASKEK